MFLKVIHFNGNTTNHLIGLSMIAANGNGKGTGSVVRCDIDLSPFNFHLYLVEELNVPDAV